MKRSPLFIAALVVGVLLCSCQENNAGNMLVLLSFLTVLLVALVSLAVVFLRRTEAQNRELAASNLAKEQLMQLISREFAFPGMASEAGAESMDGILSLPEETVRERLGAMLPDNPELAHTLSDYIISVSRKKEEVIKSYGLTPREMEVLRLCRDGLSAAEMAERMHVSVHTVNNHKQNIYAKLDVGSVSALLAKAVKEGLL